MQKFTINDSIQILAGELHFYTEGIWIAILDLNTTDSLPKDLTMTWVDNTVFKGTVYSTTIIGGKTKATIVGGSGRLSEVIPQKQYQSVTLRTILEDIARLTGHTLSSKIDPNFINTIVPAWNIATGRASESLEVLLMPFAGIWQILPEGTLWVGVEEHKETNITMTVLQRNTKEPSWTVYNEDALILPPFSIDGNKINEVIYNLKGTKITTKLLFRSSKDNIYDISSQTMINIYKTTYRCRVAAQNSDGSLELQMDPPNDLFKNGLSKVIICPPAPNMKITPAIGTHCVVVFLNGDPRYPRVIGWDDYIQPTKLEISATGGKAAARVDDPGVAGTLSLTFAMGLFTAGTYTAPDGTSIPIAPNAATVIPLKTKITVGSPDVLIG